MADYDLAIIGGGLNGASVARDAAGRGLRVILLEQNDIGAGASSAALSLVHGDLLDIERGRIWGLRRSLAERDRWLQIAPHLFRPAHFVIPMHSEGRVAWLWRLGLAAHDRFARRGPLPSGETIDLTHHSLGDALKRPFGLAFAYWGGIIDTARLTILTAMDAAERGAVILTGAKCVRADRSDIWRLVVINRGQRQIVTARALVNAAGGWIASVAETVLRVPPPRIRLVQSSQIVVRRLAAHDSLYVLQNADRRLIYVMPLAHDATLIGTTERDFSGDPAMVAVSSNDTAYLRAAANRYFREQLDPSDVIHSRTGVHVLDSMAQNEVHESPTHNGSVSLQRKFREAPLLTIFGGATMNVRHLAESALAALAPFFAIPGPWTAHAQLPGGNLSFGDVETLVDRMHNRWPFLAGSAVKRMVQAYGTRAEKILEGVGSATDLGPDFGEGLSGREVSYLMKYEYARFADDVLWRRSPPGFTANAHDEAALAQFMKTQTTAS